MFRRIAIEKLMLGWAPLALSRATHCSWDCLNLACVRKDLFVTHVCFDYPRLAVRPSVCAFAGHTIAVCMDAALLIAVSVYQAKPSPSEHVPSVSCLPTMAGEFTMFAI